MGQGRECKEGAGSITREHEVGIGIFGCYNCNPPFRTILGPAMQCIRYPCMSVQEFADSPAQSGMLSLQETTDIFLNFTAKQKPALEYPVIPRVGMKPLLCHRFQSSAYRSNQWRYRGRCDSIQFCVDKRIFIVGFGMYGSSNGSADYTVR